ncbi:MAG: DUF4168 domain-containing protein [Schleiferiaceae bacterium]|nr:DUF4168 domain-containing protein [Schleiferiaceae bacterium]
MIFSKLAKATTVAAFVFVGSAVYAQQVMPQMNQEQQPTKEVSDKDLSRFVNAYTVMQEISQETQNDMIKQVEAMGLTVERYSEIQREKQNPAGESSVTEQEEALLQKIDEKLMAIQTEAQTEMIKKVEATGITMDEYQEIGMAIQSNPKLMEKIQEMMQQG